MNPLKVLQKLSNVVSVGSIICGRCKYRSLDCLTSPRCALKARTVEVCKILRRIFWPLPVLGFMFILTIQYESILLGMIALTVLSMHAAFVFASIRDR